MVIIFWVLPDSIACFPFRFQQDPITRIATTPEPSAKSFIEAAAAAAAAISVQAENIPALLVEDRDPYPGCGEIRLSGAGLSATELTWIPPKGLVKGRANSTNSMSLLGVSALTVQFEWVFEKDADTKPVSFQAQATCPTQKLKLWL